MMGFLIFQRLYPIVNAERVCFGRLKVRISLELASRKLPNGMPKVRVSEPREPVRSPEFVVGPGASTAAGKNRGTFSDLRPQKDRDVDTVISYLRKRDEGGVEQRVAEATGPPRVASGGDRGEPTSGTGGDLEEVGVGGKQLEVISELIERGKKLREAMLHSMLEPSTAVAAGHTASSQLSKPEDPTR